MKGEERGKERGKRYRSGVYISSSAVLLNLITDLHLCK